MGPTGEALAWRWAALFHHILPVCVGHGYPQKGVIARFLGIVISMYHREHGVPHFHAAYGEYKISVEVASGIVHGTFPKRALRHVLEWNARHKAELSANWELARTGKPIQHIAPLE